MTLKYLAATYLTFPHTKSEWHPHGGKLSNNVEEAKRIGDYYADARFETKVFEVDIDDDTFPGLPSELHDFVRDTLKMQARTMILNPDSPYAVLVHPGEVENAKANLKEGETMITVDRPQPTPPPGNGRLK